MAPARPVGRRIHPDRFDAVIFDMDGVVTRTATVHADAWRRTFDAFLRQRASARGERFVPFDIETDYRRYVDGKPRYDGAAGFLRSRGIDLPYGDPSDPPDRRTICGLGNAKNLHFQASLDENGAEAFPSSVALAKSLRRAGLRTAVISASRNAEAVLTAAGCLDLFDIRVDGVDAGREGMAGKPEPDIFLAAAARLNVDPKRAAVIEDSIAGVRAGKAGGFGLVIGVAPDGEGEDLRQNGADIVVDELSKVAVSDEPLPHAIDRIPEIIARARGKRLAAFLDYDGTLTPIVDRPDEAVLSETMREAVAGLANVCIVGVISGRDLDDVRERTGLSGLYYAGSHGFDIRGPNVERQLGTEARPALERVGNALRERLAAIEGAIIETKRFSLAVHYRLVAADEAGALSDAVDTILGREPDLKRFDGKMVIEIQPRLDWHKGKALMTMLETLGLDDRSAMPIYIGDDTTDENAFRAVREFGVGIVVRGRAEETAAAFALTDPAEVKLFLNALAISIEEEAR